MQFRISASLIFFCCLYFLVDMTSTDQPLIELGVDDVKLKKAFASRVTSYDDAKLAAVQKSVRILNDMLVNDCKRRKLSHVRVGVEKVLKDVGLKAGSYSVFDVSAGGEVVIRLKNFELL